MPTGAFGTHRFPLLHHVKSQIAAVVLYAPALDMKYFLFLLLKKHQFYLSLVAGILLYFPDQTTIMIIQGLTYLILCPCL